MFDTIYIHGGLPKTGTTYIQNGMAFLSTKGLLKSTYYPVLDSEADLQSIGSGNGAELSSPLMLPAADRVLESQLEESLLKLLAGTPDRTRNLVISSELFFLSTVDGFNCLKRVLARRAKSVKFVLSVRPLREWTYSVYLQLVKAHRLELAFDTAWLDETLPVFLGQFRNMGLFGIETEVWKYQKRGQLRSFLAIVGEDPDLDVHIPELKANRSLASDEVEIIRKVNGVFKDEVLSERIFREFLRRWPDRPSAKMPAAAAPAFDLFASRLDRELRKLTHPLIARVRSILSSTEGAEDKRPGIAAVGSLPEMFDIVLSNLNQTLGPNAQAASWYAILQEQAARLEPTDIFFDPIHYLMLNQDLMDAQVDPWTHFLDHGRKEGRMTGFKRRNLE